MAPSFGRNRARRWAPLLAFALIAACGAPREPAAGGASKPAGGSTAAGSGTSAQPAAAMTAANLPVTDQCPTEGAEGFRFAGYMMFDALTRFDLTHDDRLPPLVAGLAESWSVNPDDHSQWTFQLRKGVRFHDGTPFNADAVIFALDRVMKKDSPYYSERQAGCSASYVAPIRDYEKLDDYSVRINTKGPYSFLLYSLIALGARAVRRTRPGTFERGVAAGFLGCAVAFIAVSTVSNVMSNVVNLWYFVAFAACSISGVKDASCFDHGRRGRDAVLAAEQAKAAQAISYPHGRSHASAAGEADDRSDLGSDAGLPW